MAERTYYYGVKEPDFTTFVQRKSPVLWIVIHEVKREPSEQVAHELLRKAQDIAKALKRKQKRAEAQTELSKEDRVPGHIVVPVRGATPGAIVIVEDGEREHRAIVLRVGIRDADVLMLSSHPEWSARSRAATDDELKLSGFHNKKTTYLCLARRDRDFIYSTGATFPDHRVMALEHEFMGVK